jgi:uncharacterized membrane protein
MEVLALRGVCIGTARHLQVGERAEVDAATAAFLIGIGAVQQAPAIEAVLETEAPAKPGKKEKQP